eukprot:194302-Rhodomonas_salina.1
MAGLAVVSVESAHRLIAAINDIAPSAGRKQQQQHCKRTLRAKTVCCEPLSVVLNAGREKRDETWRALLWHVDRERVSELQ